ncbi:MAG: hypothetical protein DRO04_00855 [Candidatus Iainarchaeum archaeon]|uniref:Proteasome assembly chaperone family protein n=1 Tax=Candidatus Iainarchaeum sp. TaxID=3101447 RepID=A0A497JI13_9ARCH|nr:MAG: hypothetical protein DRO04_00855 [Candidatus Diapherotrites archaeon]
MMDDEFIKVEIRELEKRDLSKYTLIEGFPGIGLTGTIAAKFLIEKLNFRRFGYIYSNIFIPIIRVRESKPLHPSRIFINDKYKLVVILSEQIIPNRYMDDFARAIAEWVQKKKIKRVISLSGIRTEEEEYAVYGIAANDKSKKLFPKYGIKEVEEGVTSGITALILLELKYTNIEAISLLATVKMTTDYKAAAEIIKKLNQMFEFNIDVKPLEEEAKKVEAEITQYLKRLKALQKHTQELEEQGAPRYYA